MKKNYLRIFWIAILLFFILACLILYPAFYNVEGVLPRWANWLVIPLCILTVVVKNKLDKLEKWEQEKDDITRHLVE